MKSHDDAPLYRSEATTIDATAGEVWSVLTDLPSWPAWMPGVKSVEVDGPFAQGMHFRWRTGAAVIRSVVLEAEPGRSAMWRGRTLGIEAVHVWRLEGREGSSTFVETGESWSGLLPRALPGYAGRALARALSRALAALRSESERRAGGSS